MEMIRRRDRSSGWFVPKPRIVAFICRQDAAAIRTETREVRGLRMNQRYADRLAGLSIPNSDGTITRSGYYFLAIRAERGKMDDIAMAQRRGYKLARSRPPNSGGAVHRSRHDSMTISAELSPEDLRLVFHGVAERLACEGVP